MDLCLETADNVLIKPLTQARRTLLEYRVVRLRGRIAKASEGQGKLSTTLGELKEKKKTATEKLQALKAQ
jgi:hypothetical protein